MDYALVGKSVSGVKWGGYGAEEKFSLASLQERLGFVVDLRPGDSVFLVAGGLSGEVAKQAARQGAKVYLIPGSTFKKSGKTEEADAETGEEEEKPKRVTGRAIALRLKQLSEENIGLFNCWLPEEADRLSLVLALNDWLEAMDQRKATANQIRQDFYQRIMRNPQRFTALSIASVKQPSKKLSDKVEAGKVSDVDVLQALAEEEIAGNPHYQYLTAREEALERELKGIVLAMPLYQHVFADLDGCGPLIAARIIAYIRRIDRFAKWEKLAKYAGFGLNDNKKQRRIKGQSLDDHPQLKSAIMFLWIRGQLIQWKRGDRAQILSDRIAFEVSRKGTVAGTPTGRAIWWMGKKLCRTIYYRWTLFERDYSLFGN